MNEPTTPPILSKPSRIGRVVNWLKVLALIAVGAAIFNISSGGQIFADIWTIVSALWLCLFGDGIYACPWDG